MAQEKISLTLKKGDFLNILKGMWGASHLKGLEISKIITNNAEVIKKELDDILYIQPSEEFAKVARQIGRLTTAKADNWEVEVLALEEANKDIIDARNKQVEDMKAALEVESTLELETISEDLLTDEITASIMSALKQIIK
jgi:hypothetical protein